MSGNGLETNRTQSPVQSFTPARTSRSKFMLENKSNRSQMRNTMCFGSNMSNTTGGQNSMMSGGATAPSSMLA